MTPEERAVIEAAREWADADDGKPVLTANDKSAWAALHLLKAAVRALPENSPLVAPPPDFGTFSAGWGAGWRYALRHGSEEPEGDPAEEAFAACCGSATAI